MTVVGIEGLFTAEDDFKVGFIFLSGSDDEVESVISMVDEQPWLVFPVADISTVLFPLASLFISFEVSIWTLGEYVADLPLVCSAVNFLNKTLLFPTSPTLSLVAVVPDVVLR